MSGVIERARVMTQAVDLVEFIYSQPAATPLIKVELDEQTKCWQVEAAN